MSSIPLPPGLRVNGFSMAPAAVTRAHSGPFGGDGAEAVVDLLQDRWRASFSTTATSRAESGAVEAWLAAQRGGANTTPLHHFARPYPRGTLSGTPTAQAAAQGAAVITFNATTGQTLLAGDIVGVSGLLLQVAADCVAVSGAIQVPIVNRLRRSIAPGAAVLLNRPTANFRLASRAAVRHAAGYAEGLALDFVEDLTP